MKQLSFNVQQFFFFKYTLQSSVVKKGKRNGGVMGTGS
jgi:hypothetical protein